jgi:3-oxoacyl-[acyl-carrier protein] reductase
MSEIEGQSFVLSGCASGIGRHLAGALLQRGARVLATDVNLEALEAHAREQGWPEGRALLRRLDVRDPASWDESIQAAAAAFGGIDVLMNIAGVIRPGWIHEAGAADVHLQLDINLKGVVFGTQAAARHMAPRGRGHIVNIASMAALAPVPGLSLYSASKYGVRAFSLAAAQELRSRGVRVTVLCPDAVQTPMLDQQKTAEQAALTFSGSRFLTVEDLERVILGRVLRRRPLEVWVPRRRGWLARFADFFPAMSFWLGPLLQRKGRRRQAQVQGG